MSGTGSAPRSATLGNVDSQAFLRISRTLLLLIVAAAVLFTVGDYGISWDEPAQVTYGNLILSYFRSHGTDLSVNEFANQRFYGPGLEPLSAWLAQSYPAQTYLIRHMVSAATMLMTLPALFVIGELPGEVLSQAWIGVMGAAALCLMPMYWGHAFVNSKDVPLAMAFAWFMTALLRLAKTGRGFVLFGAALGATLACRPGMLPLLGMFLLLAALVSWQVEPAWYAPEKLPAVATKLLLALIAGWMLMVALWPWAHQDIVWHPLLAIRQALNFSDSYPVFFAGEVYDSRTLPRSYLIWHFIIGMPLADVVCFAIGIAALFGSLRRMPESLLLVAWVALPLGLWTVARSNIYDGMRHFLFVLPGAALIVARGLHEIYGFVQKRAGTGRAQAVVIVTLLLPLPSMIRLHPYEMTFFNSIAGGMSRAAERYDTDYWLTSYREAMEWIDAQAEKDGRSVKVLVAANALALPCASFFKSDRVELEALFERRDEAALPPQFDYYLATTRYGLDRNFPETPVLHVVERVGARFTIIKGKRTAVR
ncbi:MAG: hypothetical protein HY270_15720 [Deltaproteobacteria bacterium]|nr:hypothetical protein [Deltaproteobacteria bacterium]